MNSDLIIILALLCLLCIALSAVPADAQGTGPAKPTPEQLAWQDFEIGMMISFGPSTWEDTQQDECTVPLDKINPVKLDTDQWVHAAELMGAKYIVLVAKHSGGFCLWPTSTTDYSIKGTPWRNGKGDIVRDMAESCRKKGIRLGLYLSPADRKHGAPLTWGTDWTGPQGHTKRPEDQPVYDEMFRKQLKELLSQYGDVVELWFDGATVTEIGDILKQYPKTLVVGGAYTTVRTAGEDGFAPYPNWSSVTPGGSRWLPVECPVPTRDTWYWFWNSNTDHLTKSVDHMISMYYKTVGHNANLLLNANPDRTGLIPELDMKRYEEFGGEIRRRFGRSIAKTGGRGSEIELALEGAPMNIGTIIVREDSTDGQDKLKRVWQGAQTIDHVVLMEDISQGERVLEYVVEGMVNGGWKELCRGTCIGHKKIDRLNPVMCTKVRFRCTKSLAEPILREIAVYNTSWNWWEAK